MEGSTSNDFSSPPYDLESLLHSLDQNDAPPPESSVISDGLSDNLLETFCNFNVPGGNSNNIFEEDIAGSNVMQRHLTTNENLKSMPLSGTNRSDRPNDQESLFQNHENKADNHNDITTPAQIPTSALSPPQPFSFFQELTIPLAADQRIIDIPQHGRGPTTVEFYAEESGGLRNSRMPRESTDVSLGGNDMQVFSLHSSSVSNTGVSDSLVAVNAFPKIALEASPKTLLPQSEDYTKLKYEQKKYRNKIAARRSRSKKREVANKAKKENNELLKKHKILDREVQQLQEELNQLTIYLDEIEKAKSINEIISSLFTPVTDHASEVECFPEQNYFQVSAPMDPANIEEFESGLNQYPSQEPAPTTTPQRSDVTGVNSSPWMVKDNTSEASSVDNIVNFLRKRN